MIFFFVSRETKLKAIKDISFVVYYKKEEVGICIVKIATIMVGMGEKED